MIADEAEARVWIEGQVDALALSRLERLVVLLAAENARQNLVSSASLGEVWRRHLADSAQLLALVSRETVGDGLWLDLGTGAGFPGLVIAIMQPERPVWMVESRRRRVEWLESVCADLGLGAARVIGQTLEAVAPTPASVISARAFAPLDRLVALSARFSTSDTLWLLPKGRQAGDEVATLTGWRHGFRVEPSLTDPESGIIVGHLHGKSRNRTPGAHA